MSRGDLLPFVILFSALVVGVIVAIIMYFLKKSSKNDEILWEKSSNSKGIRIFFVIFEIIMFFVLIPVLSWLRLRMLSWIYSWKDLLYLLFVVLFILGKVLVELLIAKRWLKFSRKKSIKLVVICNLILDSIDFWFVFSVLDPIYL